MRKTGIEIAWSVALLVLSYWIFDPGFSPSLSVFETTLDVNVHDTYYVVEHSIVLLFIAGWTFFTVYLLRAVASLFRNNTLNTFFVVYNSVLVLIMYQMTSFLGTIAVFPGTIVHPPFASETTRAVHGDLNYDFYRICLVITVLLSAILAFTIFRIVLNCKRKRRKKPG